MDQFNEDMQICYEYVDQLDDEGRDRVLRHSDSGFDGGWYVNPGGCKCLVGEGEGFDFDSEGRDLDYRVFSGEGSDQEKFLCDVAHQFPANCMRYGPERVWAAVKKRAGASLDDLPQPEREAVPITHGG